MKTLQDMINKLETDYIQGAIDAANYVGVSHQIVYKRAETAKLNPITIGKHSWFPITELDKWKQERKDRIAKMQ